MELEEYDDALSTIIQMHTKTGACSLMVERNSHKIRVVGSIPAGRTIN